MEKKLVWESPIKKHSPLFFFIRIVIFPELPPQPFFPKGGRPPKLGGNFTIGWGFKKKKGFWGKGETPPLRINSGPWFFEGP